MLCALIMAGGKGERFWPLSTDEKPKQFLNLLGDRTMIQMTVDRLKKLIPTERIFIVTGERYKELVLEQLPELPTSNIIMEPCGKNTAPCILLSALYIKNMYEDAVIAVLPSDHLINNDDRFREIIASADEYVCKNRDAIVTIGISPDRPETGYGYIKFKNMEKVESTEGEAAADTEKISVLPVECFVEKPTMDRALEYLKSGNYLWNGGMFIWTADNILRLSKTYLKNTYDILSAIDMSDLNSFNSECKEEYPKVEGISVDYAIMEKAKEIFVIPGDFGWDDVGSWFAVERYSSKDENNNVNRGIVKNIDSKNNMVIANGKQVVIAGAENLLVVESEDVIFVCSKDCIDNLREIKKKAVN